MADSSNPDVLSSQKKSTPVGPRALRYAGTLDAFRRVWREEGFRAFYRGSGASVLGIVHVGIYFPLYEYLKVRLSSENNDFSVSLASGTSKFFATTLTYPHEVIRTRLQCYNPQAHSISSTIKTIWKQDGLPGFYRGLLINLVRAVPSAIVTFVVYENVVSFLTNLNVQAII
jgi:solute carrier family 25 folate transporter 32